VKTALERVSGDGVAAEFFGEKQGLMLDIKQSTTPANRRALSVHLDDAVPTSNERRNYSDLA